MDFLTVENHCTSVVVNILVITNHFTWYEKATVTSTHAAKVKAIAFQNAFITNCGFPKKLLTDQGQNFGSMLIKELCKLAKELCKLANIWEVWTTSYHPEMNGQCERFNQTLISMIGTLETKEKQFWKDYLPTLVHAYNCTKNQAIDFSPYYLMYGQKPRLPWHQVCTNLTSS